MKPASDLMTNGGTAGGPQFPGGSPLRARRLRGAGGWTVLWGLVFLLSLPCPAAGQEVVRATPSQVEAAFLRNFARYVAWPASAFSDDRSPWHICILGRDPFGDVLEKTFKGRAEQGRPFTVYRAETLAKLPRCQIVFVGHLDATKRRAALAQVKNQPVLTVSDAPGFLLEGGIIRFQVAEHVGFGVNLDQARAVSLKIPTKMLEVSREVLVNGTIRRQR